MKKYWFGIIVFLSMLLLMGCVGEERSFSIDQVSIDAYIQDNGDIHVEEFFTYTFDGSYEGMTRTIESDVENFQAFLTDGSGTSGNLKPLEIDKEEDTFEIFSESKDETKQVVYQYKIEGSVKKYSDVADLRYAFFDDSNETDLHQVSISIYPPSKTMANTHYFLHEDESGSLTKQTNHLRYTNDLLKAGETSLIRFVFPADQLTALTAMELNSDKKMEESILLAEQEYTERATYLEENMGEITAFLPMIIIGVIVVATIMLIFHPNRYRGSKRDDECIRLLEKTDPLFVKYLKEYFNLSHDSFIAALFSLKQRGVVRMEEVPSKYDNNNDTYRFTWLDNAAEVGAADQFLFQWLFTEKDEKGRYFLLESLLDNEHEPDEAKEKKAEHFEKNFPDWSKLVKDREEFKGLRRPFKAYSLLSIPVLIISFGLFYYFTTIDTIGPTEQWVLPLIVGSFTIIALVFHRNKWVLATYYFLISLITGIGFSMTSAVIWTLVFYGISFIAFLVIPAKVLREDINKRIYAIRIASKLFKKGQYPVDADVIKVERRLEYAIVLGEGEPYARRCGKELPFQTANAYLPFVANPIHVATTFDPSNFHLYTTAVASSHNTTTNSSTGGGGAGAF
ncbi:DUF2207 domain-containing protein [Oceanobacillus senegalensis]|uniref:DUF2207 domain-containing protein n=1 Tax=Oceanobacillus senegalensis TaxID=1936063 RepID=UPI000A30C94E|nr:DUF2207 domain-containing protein [Oceanobacillus senegalensis]